MTDEDETCTGPSKKRGPKRSAQREMAEAAGLSRGQMWRALQVAEVPEDEFEAMIESDEPPTVTALVHHGRQGGGQSNGLRRLKKAWRNAGEDERAAFLDWLNEVSR